MPAEPLTETRAATIRATYAPGDYSIRRDGEGRGYVSGRCVRCREPVGETDTHVVVQYGALMHAACPTPPTA